MFVINIDQISERNLIHTEVTSFQHNDMGAYSFSNLDGREGKSLKGFFAFSEEQKPCKEGSLEKLIMFQPVREQKMTTGTPSL